MSGRVIARVSAIAVSGLLAHAQAPAPTVRVDVDFVQLNAIVTAANGTSVPDLKSTDFEIVVDGKQQIITQFSYVPVSRRMESPPRSAAPVTIAGGLTIAPPFTPRVPDPTGVAQSTAVIVDDLGLSGESLPFVRDALRQFARRQVDSANVAAIVRTGSAAATPLFTGDPRIIEAAAGMLAFRTGGRTAFSSVPAFAGPRGSFTDFQPRARQDISALHALGVVERIVAALSRMPGRRSILLFAENLPGPEFGDRGLVQLRDEYGRVAEAAAQAAVVIDVIDPRGAVSTPMNAEDEFIRPGQRCEGPGSSPRT